MGILRKYKDSDSQMLTEMLLDEEIRKDQMSFREHMTFIVNEHSFFTIKEEYGFLSLVHFCVGKSHRSMKSARALVKALKEVVIGKLIIHSKKDYLDKFIQYYFKTKPYKHENGTNYYLVGV